MTREPDDTGDDRPRGVLHERKRFGMEAFVALTALLGIGAGVAAAVWTSDEDEADAADEPGAPSTSDGRAPAGTTSAEPPASMVPPDVAAPRFDLGRPPRLDIPEPWWSDPDAAPSDIPGPDVETPSWE